ncbi:MAG TPA: hypothetical protein VH299_09575 [Solirubrobacterales bacterium]|nr:hypothetical protein [Solirubrobacterales bacterium]
MARREARIDQSRVEVERFCGVFARWCERRRAADVFSQYASQVDAIEDLVARNIEVIYSNLGAIGVPQSVTEVYGACLGVDRHLVWVKRVWSYFRDKWDQRDDPSLRTVLAAADEVVWSCYAPPFRKLRESVGPPPLPFIARDFSAFAVPRSRPPAELRPSDALLVKALDRLPVSVVGLPEACVRSPWWLIVLPHEVGHQVVFELDDGRAVRTVGERMMAAAVAESGSSAAEGEWSTWAHELLADAYASALVGSAHLWALAEIEGGGDEALVRRAPGYPPPLVRQAVGARVLELFGLSEAEALPAITDVPGLADLHVEEEDRLRVERLLAGTTASAAALVDEPVLGGLSLRDLLEPRLDWIGRSGAAGSWRQMLASQAAAQAEPTLEAPRLATVGALAEWAEIMAEPDADRRQARAERLCSRMMEVVPHCHEPGSRAPTDFPGSEIAAKEAPTDVTDLATELAREAGALPLEDAVRPLEVDPILTGNWTV